MSHYKPYPAYRDSGVEWIGQVPSKWEVKPIKIVATFNDDVLPDSTAADTPISYVDISSVSYAAGIGSTEEMLFGNAPSRARRKAKVGDVVISTVRTYLKAVAAVDAAHADCVYSTGFAVLRSRTGHIEPNFLKWLALNELFIQSVESHSEGLSYPAINAPELVNLKTVMPSLPEQATIAVTIDRETARFDALIAKKTRFIELLKEKRQALITHAVTKGLNPKAKMKASGVEWIGEVPEHWVAIKFNHVARVTEGLVDPKAHPYREMVLIAPNHIESGTGKILGLETAVFQNAESGKYTCKKGAVIYSKIRPALAKVAIAPCDCLCSADMYPMDCTDRTYPEWLFYLMLSPPFTSWAILESDRVAMPKINRESLADLRVFLPPMDEQLAAVAWLKAQVEKLEIVSLKTQHSIDLLKERRAAFITAAVTGQIDLRESA
ncbi:restriction endonuclease subunit S [Aeromonas caviae]|jgi:type I restriction enzyme S subunit|uniref:Restriction endonuclease subunit S n=1 Tax=Aeromonas caviae TaxID=648 RepID=A0ABU5WBB9_AERCA|nr:restriction endonuclease subunit S [Aeromonas caviae]MEA9438213.1 restriction endonuclease subunit S [Aeromonas caviae]